MLVLDISDMLVLDMLVLDMLVLDMLVLDVLVPDKLIPDTLVPGGIVWRATEQPLFIVLPHEDGPADVDVERTYDTSLRNFNALVQQLNQMHGNSLPFIPAKKSISNELK